MLSDCLREMRYELLRRTGDTAGEVQISMTDMLSILVALQLCESEAKKLQNRLPLKPAMKPKPSGIVIPFPVQNRAQPMHVVNNGGDTA